MTSEDIIHARNRRRYWVDQSEDAISMAVGSCQRVLEQEGLLIDDIDFINLFNNQSDVDDTFDGVSHTQWPVHKQKNNDSGL